MIFTCDNCGFIFSRSEETMQCPDCGKYEVRPADEAEQVDRVFAALNGSEPFQRKLSDFVTAQMTREM